MEAVLINSAQAKSVETTLLRNQLSTPIEATLNKQCTLCSEYPVCVRRYFKFYICSEEEKKQRKT